MQRHCVLNILLLVLLPVSAAVTLKGAMLPRGEGVFTYGEYAPFADRPVDVHYYIPTGGDVARMPIIFVFQGADRDYTYLIKAWGKKAEEHHFMVFVPQFDRDAYPLWDYQEVGVMDKNHSRLNAEERTTPRLIDKIFEYVKAHTATQRNSFRMYGHSAGGQFVQRFMLFHDSPYVERAIIGSPGWYTFPDRNMAFPYGIKDVGRITDEHLKACFAKDIVVQVSKADSVREWFLRKTPEADLQGQNRYERGITFFRHVEELCRRNKWPLRWRQTVVEHIGHNSVEMGMESLPLLQQPSAQEYETPAMTDDDALQAGADASLPLAGMEKVNNFIDKLVAAHPGRVSKQSMGETPGGRDVPVMFAGNGGDDKLRVWIQGGLHGNEPAGTEAVCMLAKYLLETAEGNALLNRCQVALVPVANPDGYEQGKRLSGSGLDLNRDMTKTADAVTRLLKKQYVAWRPEVALDIHEYNPRRREFRQINGHELETAYDVLFLPSGHLNIAPKLRETVNKIILPAVGQAATKAGYTHNFYFTARQTADGLMLAKDAKSPQSSSTWNALANAVSFFVEIKGIGMGRQLIDKRTDCGFTVARELLRTVCRHADSIRRTVAEAMDECTTGSREVVVGMVPETTKEVVRFNDLATAKQIDVCLPVADASNMSPTLVRQRPTAYLLDATCHKAAQTLAGLGIEVTQLKKSKRMEVEAYWPSSLTKAEKAWEGIHRTTLTTQTKKTKRKFPKGTYVVSTRQPMGNLIVTLLEPESECGLVDFEVIDVKSQTLLPIYRVCGSMPE